MSNEEETTTDVQEPESTNKPTQSASLCDHLQRTTMVSVATQTRKRRKTFIEIGCKRRKKTRATQTLNLPASKARSTKVGENPPTDSDSEYTENEADSDSDDNEDIYCPENDSD